MTLKKIISGVLSAALVISFSCVNVSALEVDNSGVPVTSVQESKDDMQSMLDEINSYLNNNEELTVLNNPNVKKEVVIPLSNGQEALFSIDSRKVPQSRKSEIWSGFDYGDYVFTFTIDLPFHGEIIHTVDYTLEDKGLCVGVLFNDTDISGIPIQGTTISYENAYIVYNELNHGFVGTAKGSVTFSAGDINATVYTSIVMSDKSSSKNGHQVYVEYTYHI